MYINAYIWNLGASQVAHWYRIRLPVQEKQETQVQSLSWEDPLEGEMTTCSSVLAWNNPWTEEVVGYSPRGLRGSDLTE